MIRRHGREKFAHSRVNREFPYRSTVADQFLHVSDHPRAVVFFVAKQRGHFAHRLAHQIVALESLEFCDDAGNPVGILLQALVNVVSVLRPTRESIVHRNSLHREKRRNARDSDQNVTGCADRKHGVIAERDVGTVHRLERWL